MIRHVHQLQHRNHPRSTLVPVQGLLLLLLLLVRLLVIAQRGLASRVLPVSRRQPSVPKRGGWVRPMRRRAWGSRPPATSLRRGASLRRRAATVRWLSRRRCCRCRRRATRRRQHWQAHEAVDRRVHRRAVDGGDEARCGRAVAAGQRDGTPSCGDSACHAIEQPRHHTLHGTRSGAEVEFMEAKEATSGGMGTVPPTHARDRESQTALLIAHTKQPQNSHTHNSPVIDACPKHWPSPWGGTVAISIGGVPLLVTRLADILDDKQRCGIGAHDGWHDAL